jgi:hypothetical protein
MARKQPPKSAASYIQRLFEDEYVQGQLRDAANGIRTAYDRLRKKPERAAEDKKLYSNVRQAATSIRKAVVALRRPEPESEPKHRFRTALIAISVVGGSVLVISKRESTGRQVAESDAITADAFRSDGASEQIAPSESAPSTASD